MTTALATTEDGEVMEAAPAAPLTLFGTDDPGAVVERATKVATALADVLSKRRLVRKFGNNEYVLLEGWTLLGSMLGVFAQVEWTRPIEDGWEARAVVRTMAGAAVGSAEAMCTKREGKWAHQDDYAVRSMAQTRALAKALRMPLGFIVELAGYAATPAEEMPTDSEVGLPDIPTQPTKPRIGMGELRQRVVDLADEHAMPLEVLADVIDSVFEGRTLGDLSKDELIKLGTDIKAGLYDVPTEPTADERVSSPEPSGASGEGPQPAMTPQSDTLQAVLDLTGGELVDEQPGASPPGASGQEERAVGVSRTSRAPARSAPTKDVKEAVEKARARATAAR